MANCCQIRPVTSDDHLTIRHVYQDAIQSQAHLFYSADQIKAWSALAWLPGFLDRSLNEGRGWAAIYKDEIQAFAIRYPLDRLALLYCRGCASRKGFSSALLHQVEREAFLEGQIALRTEASLLSYPLLLKLGWFYRELEIIEIGGIKFQRYLMQKNLS